MISPLWQIVAVMLVSGAFGGLLNALVVDESRDSIQPRWWQSVLLGIGAAFMIPLFLNSISATLIDEITGKDGKPGDSSKLLLLTGFCLVAAIASKAFIKSMSDQLVRQLKKEVAEAKNEAGDAREAATDALRFAEGTAGDAVEGGSQLVSELDSQFGNASQPIALEQNEAQVLRALIATRFKWRSLEGLVKDSKLARPKVEELLTTMVKNELIQKTKTSTGEPRWIATTRGKAAYSSFQPS